MLEKASGPDAGQLRRSAGAAQRIRQPSSPSTCRRPSARHAKSRTTLRRGFAGGAGAVECFRPYERTIRRHPQARNRRGKGRRAGPLRPAARARAREVPRARAQRSTSRANAKRERLLWDLAERVEAFIVQREACGLRDSRHVLEFYDSRAKPSRAVGARRPRLTRLTPPRRRALVGAMPAQDVEHREVPSWHAYSNMP